MEFYDEPISQLDTEFCIKKHVEIRNRATVSCFSGDLWVLFDELDMKEMDPIVNPV